MIRKFDKVTREGKYLNHKPGDIITITEKLDGANASISINENFDIEVFSRRQKLSEDNTLQGWYGYAHEHIADKLMNIYGDLNWIGKKILYGEWLVPHKIQYKEEFFRKFYPFALYDVCADKYCSFKDVQYVADALGLTTPQVFYHGEFTKIQDYIEFVGKSNMTESEGEGIVIFNQSNPCENSRTKIVSKAFSEKAKVKAHIIKDLSESEKWISEFATEARIQKIIYKLIDEELLPEIEFKNFGLIANPVSELVFEDILEEESDSKPALFDEKIARKAVNKKVPQVLRVFIESAYELVS